MSIQPFVLSSFTHKMNVRLQGKRISSTKTSCPKNQCFWCFIRKKRETIVINIVAVKTRVSGERCQRKAEDLAEPKPEKHQHTGTTPLLRGDRPGSHLTTTHLPGSHNKEGYEQFFKPAEAYNILSKDNCHVPPALP